MVLNVNDHYIHVKWYLHVLQGTLYIIGLVYCGYSVEFLTAPFSLVNSMQ